MMSEQKKVNPVDETLNFLKGAAFESRIRELLGGEETVPFVIALMDVDGFAFVNKKYGRETGDNILITVGRAISEHLPVGAEIYRVGGDEFGIIFGTETEKEEVFLFCEKLRVEVMQKLEESLRVHGEIVGACTADEKLTITVGISASPDDGMSYHDIVRKADGALFRGKQSGRNKVCLAREEKMVTKTSHYTTDQLMRLTKLSKREGIGEAILLREALDALLKKNDV